MNTPLSILLQEKGQTVQCISPETTVHECTLKMAQLKIGALLVMEDNKLKGIISERDIIWKIVVQGDDPKLKRVEDIMTKDLVTVLPSTTVQEAMRTVTEKRFRHLPVLEEDKLVGIISIGDLTRWVMMTQEKEISSLTNYIQGNVK